MVLSDYWRIAVNRAIFQHRSRSRVVVVDANDIRIDRASRVDIRRRVPADENPLITIQELRVPRHQRGVRLHIQGGSRRIVDDRIAYRGIRCYQEHPPRARIGKGAVLDEKSAILRGDPCVPTVLENRVSQCKIDVRFDRILRAAQRAVRKRASVACVVKVKADPILGRRRIPGLEYDWGPGRSHRSELTFNIDLDALFVRSTFGQVGVENPDGCACGDRKGAVIRHCDIAEHEHVSCPRSFFGTGRYDAILVLVHKGV